MMIEDFIAARIYDDEQQALDAEPEDIGETVAAAANDGALSDAEAERQHAFVTRWSPARALVECRAKRGILLEWMAQRRRADKNRTVPPPSPMVLQYLALCWLDHPDYRPASWSPPMPGTVETWGRR